MLDIGHVTVRYGNFTAVDNVSFTLREGMWLMLAGPNGAGKSTLIEAVSGGAPYEGKILYKGKDLRSMKPAQRAREIGVLARATCPVTRLRWRKSYAWDAMPVLPASVPALTRNGRSGWTAHWN